MALPRGRHKLSAGEVEADQRRRMLAAVAVALGERGYALLTVDDVLRGSGVSRRTFYEQFGDRDECLYAAYEDAERRFWAAAADAAAGVPASDRPGRVRAALAAVLGLVAAEPDTARLFTLEARAAGAEMAARHSATLERVAALLHAGRIAVRPEETELPESTERTLVGNVAALIGSYVIAGATDLLPDLEPQLAEHLLASWGPR